MIKDDFDVSNLIVTKDDFISFDLPLNKQIGELKEDMFQASKKGKDNVILDIGWYGDTEQLEGEFIVYLIIDYNWEAPLIRISTRDLDVLKHYIEYTISFLQKG